MRVWCWWCGAGADEQSQPPPCVCNIQHGCHIGKHSQYIVESYLINTLTIRCVELLGDNMVIDSKAIGNRIRELMRQQHYSNKQLAANCNLSESICSDYVNGKVQSPSANALANIAEKLGVSVDYLLGRTDNTNVNDASRVYKDIPGAIKQWTGLDNRAIDNLRNYKTNGSKLYLGTLSAIIGSRKLTKMITGLLYSTTENENAKEMIMQTLLSERERVQQDISPDKRLIGDLMLMDRDHFEIYINDLFYDETRYNNSEQLELSHIGTQDALPDFAKAVADFYKENEQLSKLIECEDVELVQTSASIDCDDTAAFAEIWADQRKADRDRADRIKQVMQLYETNREFAAVIDAQIKRLTKVEDNS